MLGICAGIPFRRRRSELSHLSPPRGAAHIFRDSRRGTRSIRNEGHQFNVTNAFSGKKRERACRFIRFTKFSREGCFRGNLLVHDDDDDDEDEDSAEAGSIITGIAVKMRSPSFLLSLLSLPSFFLSFFPSIPLKPHFSPDGDNVEGGRAGRGASVRSSCIHGPVPLKASSHITRYGIQIAGGSTRLREFLAPPIRPYKL